MVQGNCTVSGNWLDDSSYQAILKETHMIAFEYDIEQRWQRVSPFIGEYIAGNYDGRLLSDVMIEDNVIYPADVKKSIAFRERVIAGQLGEMVLRLRTPGGEYRWFRMVMTRPRSDPGKRTLVGVLEDIDIQMQYQELLRHRAELDPVSGIWNRETFFKRTKKLLEAERDRQHFLLCFDVDRFKLINKLYGKAVGDKVLRFVGNILREQTLPQETFGRLGGDVFAVCIGRSREDTVAFAKKIDLSLKDYPLAFRFFLPTGIVPLAPGCAEPVSELCDRAIMAQHKIKGNYLHLYSFYDPMMSAKLDLEHELVAHMEAGLENGHFYACYQPKYDMRNGKIVGAEALARWQHPTLGPVSPATFVPLFERNGLIIKMDEYIWESVCRTIRGWLDRGITPVPISVNVSRVHLYDKEFCGRVVELCSRYEVPHHLLELEITESAYTECPQELFPIMDFLQKAGFHFSMDDFGSGYSSLNILKDIPVDTVKFDLSFLGDARKGEQAGQSILKNMIHLMQDLQVSILAEGVETEHQAEFLQNVGCHFAQGYYYARPMQVDKFEELLRRINGKNQ